MSKTHAPGPDWTCTCGYDYFGGSAAYSWQLYEAHVQSAENDAAPSYHDLHITTASLPRTSIFNLPYGYEVTCNRVGGWCLWLNGEQVAGEYGDGLRLDVAGHVICDSLTRPIPPEGGHRGEE